MADNNTIVLKLQVQEAQAKVNIKNLEKAIDKLDGRTKEYRLAVAKLNAEEQKLINTREQLVKASGDLSKSTNNLIGNNKTGLNGVSKASGSATAAAMELGRVVSDAPYGIRGMANNVSQLASQLFFMAGQQETATVATKSSTVATTTDTVAKGANTTATVVATGATVGFTGAVKMMWSALMGPMGVLLAIQAVIASLDFFYGANKKAEDSVGDLNRAIGGTAGASAKLLAYSEIIKTAGKETKEYKNALKELKSKGYDPASESLDNFINKQLKLLVIRAKSKVIEDELNKLFTEQQNHEKTLRENQQKIDAYEIKKNKEKNKVRRDRIQQNIDYVKSQMTAISVDEEYKKLQKELIELTSEEFKLIDNITKKKKTKTKLLEIKDFDKQVEDYLSQIASVSEKEEILNATLNSDKVRIQEEYHLKRLDIKNEENKAKFKQQSDAYRIEYEAFLNQEVALGKLTKKEAKVKLGKFDIDAKAQQDKSDANYKILLSKWNDYYFDKLFIALSGEMKVAETEEDANAKRLKAITTFIEQYKVLTSAVNDFLQAESERELTIEQNKTNVLNTELNNRLNNENLSAEQRKSIQNKILQNDEKLRVKQNAIKKKAFMTQKAFNMSLAVVNTISAGIGAATATYGGPIAKIAAMTAVIGAGMAQVAIIARQKFQPEAANTPINTGGGSGGGGGSSRSEPSFNIVGRSGDSLLINAIQAQFNKPLKAYVVSRDVTSQQQLDGIIVNQAST
tara:strand:- start:4220 stop:6442 length:2223 start_codon:yes stop_codon:yes gene_type:complete